MLGPFFFAPFFSLGSLLSRHLDDQAGAALLNALLLALLPGQGGTQEGESFAGA